MMMTKHRLAIPSFADYVFERFEGTAIEDLRINTGVCCDCVTVRTTNDGALVVSCGEFRAKLRMDCLVHFRGMTVFFDKVDHRGHIVLTISTDSTAYREEW